MRVSTSAFNTSRLLLLACLLRSLLARKRERQNKVRNTKFCVLGVLDRHESFAANLGAKLTGPRILKGIERFFDGPIKTNSSQPFASPISWIDVVQFAKANPTDFVLVTLPDGSRCCQFHCKGSQVEISEDDWRLISSGALDRFPLEHPFEEDETAELATLDILEQRTSILYKKADEVAARARILHHRLGQRRHDVARRRNSGDSPGGSYRSPSAGAGTRPLATGASYDLHADLLQQFMNASSSLSQSRSASIAGVSTPSVVPVSPSLHSPHHHHLPPLSNRTVSYQEAAAPNSAASANIDHRAEFIRSLVNQKMDRLPKGEIINPPCDRCRRLRLQCVRNLTACQGCTKKHAKCSWKFVSEEEATRLKQEMGIRVDMDVDPEPNRELPTLRDGLLARGLEGHHPQAMEVASRPESRTEVDARNSTPYSPDHLSSARSDHSMEGGRISLPPPTSGFAGPPPTRRDPSRLNHMASIMTPSDYYAQSHGYGVGPPPGPPAPTHMARPPSH